MDQAIFDKLFDKINAIAISVATLVAESKAKESMCETHQKTKEDHEARIRVLELRTSNTLDHETRIKTLESTASNNDGSSKANRNWKDTLINILQMAATVAATVWAIRVA